MYLFHKLVTGSHAKGILLPFTLKCMEQDPGSSRSQNMAIFDSGRVVKWAYLAVTGLNPFCPAGEDFVLAI